VVSKDAARNGQDSKGAVWRDSVRQVPARHDPVRLGEVRNAEAWRVPVWRGAFGCGVVTFFSGESVMTTATANSRVKYIGGEVPTNGALEAIETTMPYVVNFTLEGTADMLFHRYNCEEVAEKGKAAKGSKAKKTDNIESYVWRDEEGSLCIPGEYVRQSMIHAAKFLQDPRSPRKSAMDLYKAGIISLTVMASLGTEKWDYEDARRVVIQRSAVTRIRPAMKKGWKASFQFMVNLPEYISPHTFQAVLENAGRLIGLGDFRPTYGRFHVVNLEQGLVD
jgi:hypothetical protein